MSFFDKSRYSSPSIKINFFSSMLRNDFNFTAGLISGAPQASSGSRSAWGRSRGLVEVWWRSAPASLGPTASPLPGPQPGCLGGTFPRDLRKAHSWAGCVVAGFLTARKTGVPPTESGNLSPPERLHLGLSVQLSHERGHRILLTRGQQHTCPGLLMHHHREASADGTFSVSAGRPLLDRVPPEQQAPDAADPAAGLMPSLPPLPTAP